MKALLAVWWIAASLACANGEPTIPKEWAGQIGYEFIAWVPEGYAANADKCSIQYGMGGRWITYYYEAKKEPLSQEELIKSCMAFFTRYGWKTDSQELTDHFVLSSIYEKPLPELRFKRMAFPHQKAHWTSNAYTYISSDGSIIIQYCEVGW